MLLTAIDLEGRGIEETAIEQRLEPRLVERVCGLIDLSVGHVEMLGANPDAMSSKSTRARTKNTSTRPKKHLRVSSPNRSGRRQIRINATRDIFLHVTHRDLPRSIGRAAPVNGVERILDGLSAYYLDLYLACITERLGITSV